IACSFSFTHVYPTALSRLFFFSFYFSPHHRYLHSFPTRRSSDLMYQTQLSVSYILTLKQQSTKPQAIALEKYFYSYIYHLLSFIKKNLVFFHIFYFKI